MIDKIGFPFKTRLSEPLNYLASMDLANSFIFNVLASSPNVIWIDLLPSKESFNTLLEIFVKDAFEL